MWFCGDFRGRGEDIWWESTSVLIELRVFRHLWSRSDAPCRPILAFCMGIAICHRRKFGQVWGSSAPLQKSQEISGAGRHPFGPSTITWKNRNHSAM